jgi:hypothetical protein
MQNALITTALTLSGWLILFALGQIFAKLVDPCVEFKKYLAEVCSDLDLYHEYIHATAADHQEAAKKFRKHAVKMNSFSTRFSLTSTLEEWLGCLLSRISSWCAESL